MIYIISPHFDDAIGSCGGMISKCKDYEKITIVTVFTKEPVTPLSKFALHLNNLWKVENAVKTRIAENKCACEYYNIPYINLGFTEAIYRKDNGRDLYPFEGDIFGEIDPVDNILPVEIADKINEFVDTNDTVILPAAVGKHVDHILVLKSYEYLKKGINILLYKDFSYEGLPYWDWVRENIIYISESNLNDKKNAVLKYKSQIDMLFEEYGGIDNYYDSTNSSNGKFFEVYYQLIAKGESNGT